jgi:hypothetical protein
MSKNKISEWSATASNNTDIGGIDIAEGCAPSGINNAIRELMAQVKDQQTGTDADNFTVGGNLIVAGTATGVTPAAGDSSTKFATTEFLRTMYPVGVIYTSTASTNPNTLLGFGTWAAFGAGRVMVGVGGAFSAGATGGSADAVVVSHTHTATSTDSGHTHVMSANVARPLTGSAALYAALDGGISGTSSTQSSNANITTTISTTGVSATNANLQPYVVVYMWNRTA